MVYEVRKGSKAWKETDYSKHTFLMQDKMAAGAFGARYELRGEAALFNV